MPESSPARLSHHSTGRSLRRLASPSTSLEVSTCSKYIICTWPASGVGQGPCTRGRINIPYNVSIVHDDIQEVCRDSRLVTALG